MPGSTARARVARGAGAFLLYDLITGLAAYCVITLAALWLFSVTWIRIAGEASSRGIAFSTPAQLDLAWLGSILALPLAAAVIYLAVRAYGLPRDVFQTGGRTTLQQVGTLFHRSKV